MSGAAGLRVLVFNAGSSSLKCGLYETDGTHAAPLMQAEAEAIGKPGHLKVSAGGRLLADERVHFGDAQAAVERIQAVCAGHIAAPQAVGHRLVHGGAKLVDHALIDERVLAQLHAAEPFAPLHVPAALKVVEAALRVHPDLPQAACLDTAFHRDLPDETRVLPLPRELRAAGLRRYGFHGLSCEYILSQLNPLPARVIVAHLGSGASLTAMRDGRSVDTSMGLTPDGGIPMGTRSGDLDPGVLVWLARTQSMDTKALEELVTRRSGLLGISGLSADMRALHAAAPDNADAELAIRIFCLAAAKAAAAQAATLGGLDLLVFTGGIGEHDAHARAEICRHLAWTGLALDEAANRARAGIISAPGSTCAVRVIATDEGAAMARHVWRLAGARP